MTGKRINARPSKYRAKPTVVDGIRFASQKEARRYQELKLLEKAGKIYDLELQPAFELLVYLGLRPIGKYVGDFRYSEIVDGLESRIVEDVKGFKTPLYRWKKKHVEAQYGIQIREV